MFNIKELSLEDVNFTANKYERHFHSLIKEKKLITNPIGKKIFKDLIVIISTEYFENDNTFAKTNMYVENDILKSVIIISKEVINNIKNDNFNKLVLQNFIIAHEFSHIIERYEQLLKLQSNINTVNNINKTFKYIKKQSIIEKLKANSFSITKKNKNQIGNKKQNIIDVRNITNGEFDEIYNRTNYSEFPYCSLSRCLMLPKNKIINKLKKISNYKDLLKLINQLHKSSTLPLNQTILRIVEEFLNQNI